MTRDEDFMLRKTARAACRACREAEWSIRNVLDSPGRPELQQVERAATQAIETLRAVEAAARASLTEYANASNRK